MGYEGKFFPCGGLGERRALTSVPGRKLLRDVLRLWMSVNQNPGEGVVSSDHILGFCEIQ
jgi:hypothetical protein